MEEKRGRPRSAAVLKTRCASVNQLIYTDLNVNRSSRITGSRSGRESAPGLCQSQPGGSESRLVDGGGRLSLRLTAGFPPAPSFNSAHIDRLHRRAVWIMLCDTTDRAKSAEINGFVEFRYTEIQLSLELVFTVDEKWSDRLDVLV